MCGLSLDVFLFNLRAVFASKAATLACISSMTDYISDLPHSLLLSTPFPTSDVIMRVHSLVQWNWFSVVTGCTWVTCISDVREPISLHQSVLFVIMYARMYCFLHEVCRIKFRDHFTSSLASGLIWASIHVFQWKLWFLLSLLMIAWEEPHGD